MLVQNPHLFSWNWKVLKINLESSPQCYFSSYFFAAELEDGPHNQQLLLVGTLDSCCREVSMYNNILKIKSKYAMNLLSCNISNICAYVKKTLLETPKDSLVMGILTYRLLILEAISTDTVL